MVESSSFVCSGAGVTFSRPVSVVGCGMVSENIFDVGGVNVTTFSTSPIKPANPSSLFVLFSIL